MTVAQLPPPLAPPYTSFALAALLHLDVKTIRRLAQKGSLPGVRIGREYRFARERVHAIINGTG